MMSNDRSEGAGEGGLHERLSSHSIAKRLFQELAEDDRPANAGSSLPPIKDYLLMRHLGGGGGGDVYLAVRRGSDRLVAIKWLRAAMNQGPSEQRVWRELDILTQLRVSGVPRVLDHGVHEGRLYFVTDYIDGAGLLDACQTFGLAQKAKALADLADVVQSLHERGVLHRDIKPSNVLIDRSGQPVVVDMGIAQLISAESGSTITETGRPVGTPAYMAPEQARGDKPAISTRSDVYGMGAVGMHLLCGQTPHPSSLGLHEMIRRVGQDPARNPRAVNPALPASLGAILAKATAFLPEQRYASAAAFAADLRRWLHNEPVEAAPPSMWARLNLYRKRRKGSFAMAVAACVLGLLLLVSSIWGISQMRLLDQQKQVLADREAVAKEKAELVQSFSIITRKIVTELDKNSNATEKTEFDRASSLVAVLATLMHNAPLSDPELEREFGGKRRDLMARVLKFLYPAADPVQLDSLIRSLPEPSVSTTAPAATESAESH